MRVVGEEGKGMCVITIKKEEKEERGQPGPVLPPPSQGRDGCEPQFIH